MYYCHWCNLFGVVILLHSIYTCPAENAVVSINSPSTFTASLNSERVSFTCTASLPTNTSSIILAVNMLVDGQQDSVALENRGINSVRRNDTSILTIEPRVVNNNSDIVCLVTLRPADAIESAPVTFLVQGLLSSPPDLQFMTIASRPQYFKLSWQPPFTLDITNQEQDITGYKVCFTYLITQVCIMTENTSHDFLNIRLPMEFMVTAINVIGDSNASRLLYQACDIDTVTDPAIGDPVRVVVSASPDSETSSIVVRLQLPPETTCYNVYSVDVTTVTGSPASPLNHGPLLPSLVDPTMQIVELERLSNLTNNRVYAAEIMARGDGVSQSILFSTFDVQAVTISQQDQSLKITCSYVENSLAQGCQVTACLQHAARDINFSTCSNYTFQRTSSAGLVPISEAGTYVITDVADIEQDGTVSVIGNITVFGILEASLVFATGTELTTISINTPETEGNIPAEKVTSIVGIVVGVLAVLLLVVIVVAVAAMITFWRTKRKPRNLKLNETENRPRDNEEGPTSLSDSITKFMDEGAKGPEVMIIKIGANSPTGEPMDHRPTSPFYTDVMHVSPPSYDELGPVENSPPDLPPKMKRASQRSSNSPQPLEPPSSHPVTVILPPPEFREPSQNTSQEQIHFTRLSPQHKKPVEQQQQQQWSIAPDTQVSQESLTSQNSQASGNVMYAELDHHHKNRRATKGRHSQDKTSVLYSEIKLEEIPPVLPQKKGRSGTWGSSCTSVEMDSMQGSSIGWNGSRV